MSPRTQLQYEEIREERKALIMDVALNHFANEGYHATTINHIARYAGISKGLMYNYFESKEALLAAIIQRSVLDIYTYFDINKDGYLSEDEFEIFVRKITWLLREKQSFWRLFFQLLMQNEVREQFLKTFLRSGSIDMSVTNVNPIMVTEDIMNTLTAYFLRKKEKKEPDYDPYLEMNMFVISLKGFALTYIYMEKHDEAYYEKTINRIIELYK